MGLPRRRLGRPFERARRLYRKLHGHCNVPQRYSENVKLGTWVARQKSSYKLHLQGKSSPMTLSRIQKLESLRFEWDSRGAAWEDRLSELADYRKIHGHYNVPKNYSENTKLSTWVGYQRKQDTLYREGNKSYLTTFRIQELERLDFEWDCISAAWEDRLNELAGYRKMHGHCNVPQRYSENIQLGEGVGKQRSAYNLHRQGKKSPMTALRIQALKSLGFE
jgi:hypothetical protein